MSTHIDIFAGLANQLETGTGSFPTTRENPEYIVGNDDGLDDGDIYYLTDHQVLGIRIGSSWGMIQFT